MVRKEGNHRNMHYLFDFIKSFVEDLTDDWVNDKMLGAEKGFEKKRNYVMLLVVFALLSAVCHVAEIAFHLEFSLFTVLLAVFCTFIVIIGFLSCKTFKERKAIVLYTSELLGIVIVGWLLLKAIETI